MQKPDELSRLRQAVSREVRQRTLLERELFRGQTFNDAPLVWQRRRCGKTGCRCQDGPGHGPYLYRVKLVEGKRHLEYIPGPEVAAACQARQAYEEHQRKLGEYQNLNREIEQHLAALSSSLVSQRERV